MTSSRFKTHYQTRVEEVTDPSTGEIIQVRETKTTKINNVSPGDFFMAYTAFWAYLYGIPSEGAFRLFTWFCTNINLGSTRVVMNAAYKREACEKLHISMVSYIKYMKILKNYTIQGERGPEHILYNRDDIVVLNPKFVWKGDPSKLANFEISVKGLFDQNWIQPDDAPVDFTAEN